MRIGYARVSTDDQHLELQTDALNRAGCEKLFENRLSGAKADRPGLHQALEFARRGDTITGSLRVAVTQTRQRLRSAPQTPAQHRNQQQQQHI